VSVAEKQKKFQEPVPTIPLHIAKTWGQRLSALFPHIILLAYSALALFPIFLILINSFKDRRDLFRFPYQLPIWFSTEGGLHLVNIVSFSGYQQVFDRAEVTSYFGTSFMITGAALLLILVTGSMAAFALSEYSFRLNRFLGLYMAIGIMIPIRLGTVSLIRLANFLGIYNTPLVLILVYAAAGLPVAVFILSDFMRRIPGELKDAARVDGATEYRILFTLIMPLIRPALATVLVFNMLPIWNDLWFPLTLAPEVKTVTSGLSTFAGQYKTDWTAMLAALTLAMLPALVLYAVFSRQFISGLTRGALK
jgi:raffinose/stachyose/melibiose transport system permease protein